MNPIPVGLFVDSFTPVMDGVTMAVHNCAYWLESLLGPTCVIAPRFPGYADKEKYEVIRFLSIPTFVHQPYRIGLAQLDCRLHRVLGHRRFSLVHAHSPFSAGHAALRTARQKGIPIVATLHSKYSDNLYRALPVKRIIRNQLKRIADFLYAVDRVWIPQPSVAAILREYGYAGPYEVVENGIDFSPPSDTGVYRAQGEKHLNLPAEARVGLYVGQFILEKNLEFLLRSLPLVLARLPGFHLVMVGKGYAKTRLQKLAYELGIQQHVTFHDIITDRELLKAIYARGDVFLLPSLYDNAPLVIREAAALKTPSLLVRGSTAAEVIADNKNGFLAEDDTEAFSTRLVQVIENKELLKKAGAEAQRTLCRSWQSVACEIRDKYLAILAEWKG